MFQASHEKDTGVLRRFLKHFFGRHIYFFFKHFFKLNIKFQCASFNPNNIFFGGGEGGVNLTFIFQEELIQI